MKGKSLIVLITTILSLVMFDAGICLAVLATPVPGDITEKSPISVLLKWSWDEGGTGEIEHFRIKYRKYKEVNTDDWTEPGDLPQEKSTSYPLGGLLPNKEYQWMIMAEAKNPADNSPYSDIGKFTTEPINKEEPPSNNGGGMGPITLKNPLNQENIWDAIDAVLNFLILIAFAIAPILIIYSAFLMIFAAGDATKINRARTIISWTLIALAIILSAKVLPSVIKGAFGG